MSEVPESTNEFIDVVFDGPPAHESGRFVEVEDSSGASVGVGEWIDRENGLWALRFPDPRLIAAKRAEIEAPLRERIARLEGLLRDVEWCDLTHNGETWFNLCYWCESVEGQEHADDCEWSAAMKEAGNEERT